MICAGESLPPLYSVFREEMSRHFRHSTFTCQQRLVSNITPPSKLIRHHDDSVLTNRSHPLDEDIVEVVLKGVKLGSHLHFSEVNLPPQNSSDTTKATAELRSFLWPVGNEFQRSAKGLVIVGKPAAFRIECKDEVRLPFDEGDTVDHF